MTSTKEIIWPEEDYSTFYKQQLFLAVQDAYAAFSGKFTKFEKHVATKVMTAHALGLVTGMQTDWLESADGESHAFRAANVRNFMTGKDSQHAIWAVFDLYIKFTNPLVALGFKLDGYLQRLGLVVGDFVHPAPSNEPQKPKATGFFAIDHSEEQSVYLDIQPLQDRHFAIVHFVELSSLPVDRGAEVVIDGLKDHRTRANKGVCIPQTHNDLLIIRDVETADVSFAFLTKTGDDIRLRLIDLGGETRTHTLKPDDFKDMQQEIRSMQFGERVNV